MKDCKPISSSSLPPPPTIFLPCLFFFFSTSSGASSHDMPLQRSVTKQITHFAHASTIPPFYSIYPLLALGICATHTHYCQGRSLPAHATTFSCSQCVLAFLFCFLPCLVSCLVSCLLRLVCSHVQGRARRRGEAGQLARRRGPRVWGLGTSASTRFFWDALLHARLVGRHTTASGIARHAPLSAPTFTGFAATLAVLGKYTPPTACVPAGASLQDISPSVSVCLLFFPRVIFAFLFSFPVYFFLSIHFIGISFRRVRDASPWARERCTLLDTRPTLGRSSRGMGTHSGRALEGRN